ncbi:YesL family protein [Mediterraneibacter agrestimuris]|uniref:YesL family protein n=1 Tax=Mediterraneibacter agrestimuris TaxID=2941333 RepID=UPI0020407635|nr:YesL family protein [Mediterraneibacter agrestimuris]
MKSKTMNPVLDFINTLCNFVVLNFVFLITCLPVITIGAALSSLYYVTLREARGEYGYLVRTYLSEFKNNLKKGTIAFLILFLAGAVFLFNIVFWFETGTMAGTVLAGILIAAAIAWFLIVTYTFPLIGRFENSTTQTLKNAFGLAMSNMKSTFALIIMDTFVFFLCLYLSPMKLFMVLLGFAFVAYCQSFILKKVFEPYEKDVLALENTEI